MRASGQNWYLLIYCETLASLKCEAGALWVKLHKTCKYRLGPAVNQTRKVTLGSVLGPPTQGLFYGSPELERLKCHSGQLSKPQAKGTDPRAFSTYQRTKSKMKNI